MPRPRRAKVIRVGERQREYPALPVLLAVVVHVRRVVGISAGPVHGAVEIAEGVAQQAVAHGAGQLRPDVAIRQQVAGQCRFHEAGVLLELQAFQADRGLELARLQSHPWREARVDPGVLDDRLALAEVRHQAEVIDVVHRALEDRASAAHEKGVGRRRREGVLEVAIVDGDVGPQPEHRGAIRRRDRESGWRRLDHGGRPGAGRGRFIADLELALENPDVVLGFLKSLLKGRTGTGRCSGCCLRRGQRRERCRGHDCAQPPPSNSHSPLRDCWYWQSW